MIVAERVMQASPCCCGEPTIDGAGGECVLCGRYPLAELVVTALGLRYGNTSGKRRYAP